MAPKGYYKKNKNQPKPNIKIDWSDVLNMPPSTIKKEADIDPFADAEKWDEEDMKAPIYNPAKNLEKIGGIQLINPADLGHQTKDAKRQHYVTEKRRVQAEQAGWNTKN